MLNVKNTILERLSDTLFPHYCCSCGEIGTVFCDSCKYDIISEPFGHCAVCLRPTGRTMLCDRHRLPYSAVYVVGWRSEGLERLVNISKFESVRLGCDVQAELLLAQLPDFLGEVIVVPVPTIRPHIRQRGYGHAERMARLIAKVRGYAYNSPLVRIVNHIQHGATKKVRLQQAAESFALKGTLRPNATYIIVDDVFTTGATVKAAAGLLHDAGAKNVVVAVTTRQPKE